MDYSDSTHYYNSMYYSVAIRLYGGMIKMNRKLFESVLKIMELIWPNEPVSAKQVSAIAAEKIGWSKNTTYTVIGKLEAKGYIKREDPGYICTSLISREEVCKSETRSLIDTLFKGSKKALFSALLEDEELSEAELEELRSMIAKE